MMMNFFENSLLAIQFYKYQKTKMEAPCTSIGHRPTMLYMGMPLNHILIGYIMFAHGSRPNFAAISRYQCRTKNSMFLKTVEMRSK